LEEVESVRRSLQQRLWTVERGGEVEEANLEGSSEDEQDEDDKDEDDDDEDEDEEMEDEEPFKGFED
jgi:hypothetical protein